MAVETKKTFCRICHAACPMDIDVEDGTQGYTCIKGRQLADQFHDPARLREPLRRRPDGTCEPVASTQALDEIAARIAEIVAEHGPRAVASYTGTGAYQNSVGVPIATAWHAGFDSPSVYTSLTIDQPAHRTSLARMGAWEAGWNNFTDSDVSMAIGYNPIVSSYAAAGGLQGTNPIVKLRQAKARGLKLIVIDPRKSELAGHADIWLQVRPGEDPTLLACLINVIVANDLHDHEFCERHVEPGHLQALADAVAPFTPEYAAERCGLDAELIVQAAHLFGEANKGTAGSGTGPNMAPHGSLMESLALTLNVICGRVNQPGDVLESPYMSSPGDTRRAQVIAPSNPTPGAPQRVRGLSGLAAEMMTNALSDEILLEGEGQVRALIVSGGNPVQAWPDQAKTIQAMQELDLLVVIDHRMTATAELADYVIAPRGQLERADIPNVMDRRFPAPYTNYTDAVIDSGDDVLNEWEVFAGIAARNDTPIDLPGGRLPVQAQLTEQPLTDHDVIDHVFGAARVPMSEWREHRQQIHTDNPVRVIEADPQADARFSIAPTEVLGELAEVLGETQGVDLLPGFDAAEFPYRLIGRRLTHALNSLGSELPGLAKVATTNFAYVHPDDMAELEIESGDLLRIRSQSGSLIGVAEADTTLKRGVISMAHSWGGLAVTDEKVHEIGAPTNRLVDSERGTDRVTGLPVMSAIPVRAERG